MLDFQTCEAKNKVLIASKRQIINLSLDDEESGCENVYYPRFERSSTNTSRQNFTNMIICKNIRSFATIRERWWFIGISNCNGTQVIILLRETVLALNLNKEIEEVAHLFTPDSVFYIKIKVFI